MMRFNSYIEKILTDFENMDYDHIASWEIERAREELTEFVSVLGVAIARGEKLGYMDDDYRARLEELSRTAR